MAKDKAGIIVKELNSIFYCLLICNLLLSGIVSGQVDSNGHNNAQFSFVIGEWSELYTVNAIGIGLNDDFIASSTDMASIEQHISFVPVEQMESALITNQDYWGKFHLENRLPDGKNNTEWVLQFSSSITEIDLYVAQGNGKYEQYLSGEFRPYRLKSFQPSLDMNTFKVTLPKDKSVQFYFRARGDKALIPPSFDILVRHTTSFASFLETQRVRHYFLLGFLAMMIIISLIGAAIKRDRSFIYYSIYIIVLATHASNSAGEIEEWLGHLLFPENPKYAYLFNSMILVGFVAYIGFMRHFLDLKNLMPKWDQLYKYLLWLCLALLPVHIIVSILSNFSSGVADLVLAGYIVVFLICTVFFTYYLFKTRDIKGYFIASGMLFLLIDLSLNILSLFEVVHYPLLHFKIGFIIEILIFSLGLAYREHEFVKSKEKANFDLQRDLLEQKHEQGELDRLKKLNEFKSQFYTNITHEFRTPLTVIMGMNDNITGHERERNLIKRNSKNLLQLINQLLDLSRTESNNMKVNNSQGDIVAFLQYLTESFYSMATDKGVRLTFYSEIKELIIGYDEVKIQHIFYNLISNAIKFTQEGGKVIFHLKTEREGEQHFLKILVKDTGIGIPQDRLPFIFDRFYQVDHTDTRMGEGTGIGLALVQQLVQLMEGRIDVSSEAHEGSEFLIMLPYEEVAVGVSSTNMDPIQSKNVPIMPIEAHQSPSIGAVDADIDHGSELPIILIIEDNIDVTTYIQSILESEYQVHTAKNGEIGIQMALDIIPDIVISDVMMPIKNGYEVCSVLKSDERTSHIPVILLTAKSTQSDKEEGLRYGADAFLTKPFHKEELKIRIERLRALRSALQDKYAQAILVQSSAKAVEEVPQFIQKLTQIVLDQIDDVDFGVSELSKGVLMSDMQVYRKLKAITNQTPSTFIRSVRLKKGEGLLKETDLSISEIAYAVGFSDPSYFSRMFHQVYRMSPRELRQKQTPTR